VSKYVFLNKYRDILELFYNSGQYVGGADGLFDYYEKEHGQPIDRGCSGCVAGFLKFAYKELKELEDGR
jgi:hypothetical protein